MVVLASTEKRNEKLQRKTALVDIHTEGDILPDSEGKKIKARKPYHKHGGRYSRIKTLPPQCAQVQDAREKIAISKERLGTWAEVAKWFSDEHKKGAVYRLVNDETFRPSIAFVETIERVALPPVTKPAAVCPSCLAHGKIEVHGEGLDCHNRPVVAVVTLAPGEVVRSNGHAPTRKPDGRGTAHMSRATFDRINANRKRHGCTWDEYLDIIESLHEALDEPA